MTIFDEQYKAFAEMVIPENALDNQRRDMKMSFYSGAVALISCISILNAENAKAEDSDIEFTNIVNEIYKQMEEFLTE